MYVDSHCHLAFPELAGDIDGVLARMAAARVGLALSVCTRLEEFEAVHGLALRDERIYASVGVHPDTTRGEEPTVQRLVDLAARPKVVAIGETGLDYYRLPEPLDWQRERFRVHIRAAREAGKPLIIHTRSAAEDTLRIMREERAGEAGGVMHCFTESLEVARAAIEMGFFISFSGIVTFKSAQRASGGRAGAADGADPDRDRCAVPCARAVSRPDQRAVVRAARRREARRSARHFDGGRRSGYHRQFHAIIQMYRRLSSSEL